MLSLHTEGKQTAQALAQRFEVSARTIYRDIDALGVAGVPIIAESGIGGGFVLPKDYRIDMNGMTSTEIRALFLSISNGTLSELGLEGVLRNALQKLLSGISIESRTEVARIKDRVYLDTVAWHSDEANSSYLEQAQQAIWNEMECIISYQYASGQKSSELQIQPIGLVAKAGIWFIVANHVEELRVFRIFRIDSFRMTGNRFNRTRNFNLKLFWEDWVARYDRQR